MKVKNRKNFTAFVYSGMNIMNLNLLKIKFKDYVNFEKKLYPKIIQKYKSKFAMPKGFWHSIDNVKDIDILNKKNKSYKYKGIKRTINKFKR